MPAIYIHFAGSQSGELTLNGIDLDLYFPQLPFDNDGERMWPDFFCGLRVRWIGSFFWTDDGSVQIPFPNEGSISDIEELEPYYFDGVYFYGPLLTCNEPTAWNFPFPLTGDNVLPFGGTTLVLDLDSPQNPNMVLPIEFLNGEGDPMNLEEMYTPERWSKIANRDQWLEEICQLYGLCLPEPEPPPPPPDATVVIQLSENFLETVLIEERRQPNSIFAQLSDGLDQIPIGDPPILHVTPVVILPTENVSLDLSVPDQHIIIRFQPAEIQIIADHGNQNLEELLHELEANIMISTPVGIIQEDQIQVGLNFTNIGVEAITVEILSPNPYNNNNFLAEIFVRQVQALYQASMLGSTDPHRPLPTPANPVKSNDIEDFDGVFTGEFCFEVENDDGVEGNPARMIRVSPVAGNDALLDFEFPCTLFIANITVTDSSLSLDTFMEVDCDIIIHTPLSKQIIEDGQGNDIVEVFLADNEGIEITNLTAIRGASNLDIPEVRDAIEERLETLGQEEIAEVIDFWSEPLHVFDIQTLEGTIRDLVFNSITDDGDNGVDLFLEFWVQDRSDLFQSSFDAFTRIFDNLLVIAFNGGSLPDFHPLEGHDFGMFLSDSIVLELINNFLYTEEDYDDINGVIVVNGGGQIGDHLNVTGFTNETGTIRNNTRFTIGGFTYITSNEIPIVDHAANLVFSPELQDSPNNQQAVTFEAGLGLPNHCQNENDHSDFLIERYCINELDASINNEYIQLEGSIEIFRDALLVREINGDMRIRFDFNWRGTARIFGFATAGETELSMFEFNFTYDLVKEGTLFAIDGINQVFRVESDVEISDLQLAPNQFTISPAIPNDSNLQSGVYFLWVAKGNFIAGSETIDAGTGMVTSFIIANVTEGGNRLIRGSLLNINRKGRRLLSHDVEISEGTIEIDLEENIPEDDSPADGDPVAIFDGWGSIVHRAEVDGNNQSGSRIRIRNIRRFFRKKSQVQLEGIDGIFTLLSDDNGTEIINNAATLNFGANIGLGAVPADNAIVTFWDGRQEIEQNTAETPYVNLGNNNDPPIPLIRTAIVSVLGGSIWSGLLSELIIFTVRRIFERVAGGLVENQFGIFDLPFLQDLRDGGIEFVTYFKNPVIIDENGLTIRGNAGVTSRFTPLDDSLARTNGPYVAIADSDIQLNGGLIARNTEYVWLTGDGQIENMRRPIYNFPGKRHHILDLTTLNNQFGDGIVVRNRHLGTLEVINTLPIVEAIEPIVANEGQEIEIIAQFSDTSYLDTHSGYVLFGDGTLPVQGNISEISQAPLAQGTLRARHTYCDNGIFEIEVHIIDEHGGRGIAVTTATILNLPPVVNAGRDMVTHPCVPLRLVGYFEDPGWCDTHTGTWNFGDCSPLLPATIIEEHESPVGRGIAIGTHCYKSCGIYSVELIVIDDDGDDGSDQLIVKVVDIKNKRFELGFRRHPMGIVANEWHPYGTFTSTLNIELFFCEKCIIRSGIAAQGIRNSNQALAGIYQIIETNPGWEYQFTVFAHLPLGSSGQVRIGLDINGETDFLSDTIIWSSSIGTENWVRLTVRGVAVAYNVTLFLEANGHLNAAAYFDEVDMLAFPCTPDDLEIIPPPSTDLCMDWSGIEVNPLSVLGNQTEQDGLIFETISGQPLRIVDFGLPVNQTKLEIPFPNDGLRIRWEGNAYLVEAEISAERSLPSTMTAFGADNQVVESNELSEGLIRQHKVEASGISFIELTGKYRANLLRVCISRRTLLVDVLIVD